MLSKDVRMEDINRWILDFLDEINSKIEDYPENSNEENELFDNIQSSLEVFFNYPDYRRYN